MDEKDIIIPQFGMEPGNIASCGMEAGGPDGGLILRDEITVIIYEVDGLYLTEEEYHAYLQEQSEIYQSQLDAYNEAVSQAEAGARMKADEFVASLRPDVSDRVEDYLGSHSLSPDGSGMNRTDSPSIGQARTGETGEGRNWGGLERLTRSFLPEPKEYSSVKENAGARPPLPAVRPELPDLFRGDEITDDSTQALRNHCGLSVASALPGLSGYHPGEAGKDSDEFSDRWRGWPERESAGDNRIIAGELFEPGD